MERLTSALVVEARSAASDGDNRWRVEDCLGVVCAAVGAHSGVCGITCNAM